MGRALATALALLLACATAATAAEPPSAWDGSNPFACTLQKAGFGAVVPHPEADPYCVEFDKRRQNVTELGVLDFLSREPARVAAAVPKCFYFQSDHWRGSLVQGQPATKTYEWDGHYFFDKAKGEGGVWVSNFNVNGQTGDPRDVPGFPEEWKPFFGPGTGGVRTRNEVDADPACVARAKREGSRIYAGARAPRCVTPGGAVRRSGLGPVRLGQTESEVRRALGPPKRVKRGWLRWCVVGGGRFLIAQRGDRSGDLGASGEDPALLVLSTHRAFRFRGVGAGSSLRSLRRRLRGERRAFRYGHTRVFLARRRSPVLFGVRRRKVRFVAVRSAAGVRGRRSLRSYLRRAAG